MTTSGAVLASAFTRRLARTTAFFQIVDAPFGRWSSAKPPIRTRRLKRKGKRARMCEPFSFFAVLDALGPSDESGHQRDHEQDDEHPEQKPGGLHGKAGDAAEAH